MDLNSSVRPKKLGDFVSLREKGVDLNINSLAVSIEQSVSLREKGVDLNKSFNPPISQSNWSPFVRREWI